MCNTTKNTSTVSQVIEIYTDGACRGNPGIGGWGAVLSYGAHRKEIFGGEGHTTNNRMELTAVIRALEQLKNPSVVKIYTDSQYVQKGISTWINGWKNNGWRTSGKATVKNIDLWQQLDALIAPHQIEWLWVKGHADNDGNIKADQLANLGADQGASLCVK